MRQFFCKLFGHKYRQDGEPWGINYEYAWYYCPRCRDYIIGETTIDGSIYEAVFGAYDPRKHL